MAAPGTGWGGDMEQAQPSAWAVQYARHEAGPFVAAPSGRLRVYLVTDPWSVWCWGFEPVRRALELRYPSIEFVAFVGGMFERLPDPEQVGFDVERFFANVQRATGMPITAAAALTDRPTSTYPACVHIHAVRLLAPDREAAYLRALREAVYLDGRNVSRPEHAATVAQQVGVPRGEFLQALASGEPEREFRERIAVLERLGIHGYPTLVLVAGTRAARIDGFQHLPAVLGVAEAFTGRLHPAMPEPELDALFPAGGRIATREVAEVLGISVEDAVDRLEGASARLGLARQRHATGDVWAKERDPPDGPHTLK